MAAEGRRFANCKTDKHVHYELIQVLACDYLHENDCKANFDRFNIKCWTYLEGPAEKNLKTSIDIIRKLESKSDPVTNQPLLSPGNYAVLREVTRDIDSDIPRLIDEAGRKIESIKSASNEEEPSRQQDGEKVVDQVGTPCSSGTKRPQPEPKGKSHPAEKKKKGRQNETFIEPSRLQGSDQTEDVEYVATPSTSGTKRPQSETRGKSHPARKRKKRRQNTTISEEKINKLKEVLYKQNLKDTKRVPVVPLQKSAEDLPVELLFAPVSVREDLEVKNTKKRTSGEKTKDDSGTSLSKDKSEPKQKSDLKREQKSKLVNTPGDMFYKNGEPARFVFMRGEAGRGKTVYCQQLMKYWCTAKEPGKDKNTLTNWEKGADEYEFLFRVALRHVHINRSLLIDMICLDMFKHHPECYDAIRHVLSNDKYRCFVVIDGLDEWKISDKAKLEITNKCFPNIEGISNTTYFITTRPWKFEEVDVSVRKDDAARILELHGLDQEGIELVVENVLKNFYEIITDLRELRSKFFAHLQESKSFCKNLQSLMEIPLLAITYVQLWYEESEVIDSMTSFYIDLVRLLIRRAVNAEQTDTIFHSYKEKLNKDELSMQHIPEILKHKKHKTFVDFIEVICKLGKIGYQDLVSLETNLVFQKDELDLDETELEFALKVGLLSQTEAPGISGIENISVSFFHKSIQEFLTAVNIVCKDEDGIESLCSHLTSVKQIMDLSNVIMFTSGLSPSLGSILSQRIVSVTDKDVAVCKYRETFPDHDYDLQRKVGLLYGVQVSCYQEMKHNVSTSGSSLQDITYHVADVCVGRWSDTETKRVTGELLCDHHDNIKSLYVNGEVDITNSINTFLHNTTSCQHLCIIDTNLQNISGQLHSLKTLHLTLVTLSPDFLCSLKKLLQNNTVLQSLTLEAITCIGERGEEIEITLPINSTLTSLQRLCIMEINLDSISDQLHSLKTLHLEHVTLSPDAVCGLQKLLQNSTVLQSLTLKNETCRGERAEDIPASLYDDDDDDDDDDGGGGGGVAVPASLCDNDDYYDDDDDDVPASLCDVLRVLPESLTTLEIRYLKYEEDIMMLVDVLPRLHHLHSVRYHGEYNYSDRSYRNAECHAAVAQTLSCMEQLQRLQLWYISLGDRSLELTSEMSEIENVVLVHVNMTSRGWNSFVHSLINIPHHFVVKLYLTDDESRTMIHSSPCFTVTRDDRPWLSFTRVAPSMVSIHQSGSVSTVYR